MVSVVVLLLLPDTRHYVCSCTGLYSIYLALQKQRIRQEGRGPLVCPDWNIWNNTVEWSSLGPAHVSNQLQDWCVKSQDA